MFAVEAFVEDSLTVMRGPRIEVELIFEKRTAAWRQVADDHDHRRQPGTRRLDSQLWKRGAGRPSQRSSSGCCGRGRRYFTKELRLNAMRTIGVMRADTDAHPESF